MTVRAQIGELRRLVGQLAAGRPAALGAIPWASPVLMFGNLLRSRVATLGLNPSNLEFVDKNGIELSGNNRRFETLISLDRRGWDEVQHREIERMWLTCSGYFLNRPYDGWFKRLERIIGALGVSYYFPQCDACHLDLVPFATAEKWSALEPWQRTELMSLGVSSFVELLRVSEVRVLVLNGMSVVRAFSNLLRVELDSQEMTSWGLRRQAVPALGYVKGYAYVKRISSINGKSLGRDLLVLGYNHNMQSSYGVSNAVIDEVRHWIARSACEAVR